MTFINFNSFLLYQFYIGEAWETARLATFQLNGKLNVGMTKVTDAAPAYVDESTRALQLKIVNKAGTVIRIEELSWATTGQNLDVPIDATANLGFLITQRQEPLKFKAYENGTGVEMLLNGQKILPIDVDTTGISSIVVVHRPGKDWLLFHNWLALEKGRGSINWD